MWHLNVRKSQGFTLIEMLATGIIISIVAAIAAPNLLGLLNRNRVNQGLAELEGAIKEAQRQAIRQGKSCRVNIDTSTNTISAYIDPPSVPPTNCLLSTREISSDITIRTNLPGSTILFSSKGSTTNSGTVVVSSDSTDTQKCFVISLGLGIMRTGEYTGTKTDPVDSEYCQ